MFRVRGARTRARCGIFAEGAGRDRRSIPDGLNSDIHASPEYRAHAIVVMARRVVTALPPVEEGKAKNARSRQEPRIGEPVPRKEDLRFVTGNGSYADDAISRARLCGHGALAACPCRRIRAIEVADALRDARRARRC